MLLSRPPGLGHHNVSSAPMEVGGDLAGVEVKQISTYGDCSLAVSADGQLYGWGNSEYLQLASVTEATQVRTGEVAAPETRLEKSKTKTAAIVWSDCCVSAQINSPRLLPLNGCGKVVQAACGGTQVAVVNGQLHTNTPTYTVEPRAERVGLRRPLNRQNLSTVSLSDSRSSTNNHVGAS